MSVLSRGTALAAVAAGGVAVRQVIAATRKDPQTQEQRARMAHRWHVVTVLATPEQIAPAGELPAPLAELGDDLEVEMRPAPGDRGTELAARYRGGETVGLGDPLARLRGDDPRQALRSALRRAKQLVETGEILESDQPGTSHPSLLGAPLRAATRLAGGEGRA